MPNTNPALTVLQKEFEEKYKQYLQNNSPSVAKVTSNIKIMEKYGIEIEDYIQLGPFRCSDILTSLELPKLTVQKNRSTLLGFIIDTFLERGFEVNLFGIDPATGKVTPENFTITSQTLKTDLQLSTWDKFWGFFGIETANAKTVKAFEAAKSKEADTKTLINKAAETKASDVKNNYDFINNVTKRYGGLQYFNKFSPTKKEIADKIFSFVLGPDYDKNLLKSDIEYKDKEGQVQNLSLLSYITARFSNLRHDVLNETFFKYDVSNGYSDTVSQIKTEIYALTGMDTAGLTEDEKEKIQQEKSSLNDKGLNNYLKDNLNSKMLQDSNRGFIFDYYQGINSDPDKPSNSNTEMAGKQDHFFVAKEEVNTLFEGENKIYHLTDYEKSRVSANKHTLNQVYMLKAFQQGDYETAYKCAHENLMTAAEYGVDSAIRKDILENNERKKKPSQDMVNKLKNDAMKSFNMKFRDPVFVKLTAQQKAACLMALEFNSDVSEIIGMKGQWGKREKEVFSTTKQTVIKKEVDVYDIKPSAFSLIDYLPDMYKKSPEPEKEIIAEDISEPEHEK